MNTSRLFDCTLIIGSLSLLLTGCATTKEDSFGEDSVSVGAIHQHFGKGLAFIRQQEMARRYPPSENIKLATVASKHGEQPLTLYIHSKAELKKSGPIYVLKFDDNGEVEDWTTIAAGRTSIKITDPQMAERMRKFMDER